MIFRQKRVGRDLDPFTVNKFRTMRSDAGHEKHRAYVLKLIAGEAESYETDAAPVFKLAADDRFTRLGRFLRKTSLDELPQLFNVVRGEMARSGRGRRSPTRSSTTPRVVHALRRQARHHRAVAGHGRSLLTIEEMIVLDTEYVQRRTFWLNVGILARTVPRGAAPARRRLSGATRR